MMFTPNDVGLKLRFCQKCKNPALYLLISVLLAPDIKQLLKGTRRVKMREFSRFYDEQEPAVSRLLLAVNVMLNLSIHKNPLIHCKRVELLALYCVSCLTL